MSDSLPQFPYVITAIAVSTSVFYLGLARALAEVNSFIAFSLYRDHLQDLFQRHRSLYDAQQYRRPFFYQQKLSCKSLHAFKSCPQQSYDHSHDIPRGAQSPHTHQADHSQCRHLNKQADHLYYSAIVSQHHHHCCCSCFVIGRKQQAFVVVFICLLAAVYKESTFGVTYSSWVSFEL